MDTKEGEKGHREGTHAHKKTMGMDEHETKERSKEGRKTRVCGRRDEDEGEMREGRVQGARPRGEDARLNGGVTLGGGRVRAVRTGRCPPAA